MSGDSVAQLEDASDEDEGVVRVLALVAGYYGHTYFDKQPFHNSILTGSDWVAERIEGNPTRMFRSYRMKRFCTALGSADRQTPWYRVSVEEKPAIYLYSIAKSASSCDLQECFQHSGETIHRCAFKLWLRVFTVFLMLSVTGQARISSNQSPHHSSYKTIQNKLVSSINAASPLMARTFLPTYRARVQSHFVIGPESFVRTCSLRVRSTCSSSTCCQVDSTVLADARRKGFKTPPGLGFAGYGLATKVMTPYLGVRYHLKESQIISNCIIYDKRKLAMSSKGFLTC
ncbi:putative DDE Tnp4 domain-containing protein [Phytophthora infestans]|uniref:Putative DDE Tnp4 domain-containing protein n=1 Tax=Phytophthora infestans TaxID=4787 RepID=A0A833WGT2_PHYIN|nr:putative DDE Tnp4 domain-containing protein [Phytophthora infestans]